MLRVLEGRPVSKGQSLRVELMVGHPFTFVVTKTSPSGTVIWPSLLRPNATTVPSPRSANVCKSPPAIAVTSINPELAEKEVASLIGQVTIMLSEVAVDRAVAVKKAKAVKAAKK